MFTVVFCPSLRLNIPTSGERQKTIVSACRMGKGGGAGEKKSPACWQAGRQGRAYETQKKMEININQVSANLLPEELGGCRAG